MSSNLFAIAPNPSVEEKIYGVSEVSMLIKRNIEKNFSDIKVKGEVSGLKIHSSGHAYLALKDNDALMDAVCWGIHARQFKYKLEDGLEIVAKGRMTTYPGRSRYQFVIDGFEPAGQGALLKILMERKERMEKEGLFDASKKKPLPKFPKKIALVTSPTGAVLQDMLHRLRDRFPVPVMFCPVAVQGKEASQQVAQAIVHLNSLGDGQKPCLIIVARGGGSIEDLWAFNEEETIRAVVASDLPVISAIGHETDTTLIDYASDLRASTPTAAIELCVPDRKKLLYLLQQQAQTIRIAFDRSIRDKKYRLHIAGQGVIHPKVLFMQKSQLLDELSYGMSSAINRIINGQSRRLSLFIPLSPQKKLHDFSHALSFKTHVLGGIVRKIMDDCVHRLALLGLDLDKDSPSRILDKGYCWVTSEGGHIVTKVADASAESTLKLRFSDGTLNVTPQRKVAS